MFADLKGSKVGELANGDRCRIIVVKGVVMIFGTLIGGLHAIFGFIEKNPEPKSSPCR